MKINRISSRILFVVIEFVNRCMSFSKCNSCSLYTVNDDSYFGDYICRGRSDFLRCLKIDLHISNECAKDCDDCKYGTHTDDEEEDLCEISRVFCKMLHRRPEERSN